MDEAINRTLYNCPDQPDALTYLPKIFSPALSDPSNLATIACAAARLSKLTPDLYATFYYKFCIVSGFVGILSSILALLSYSSLKEFSAPTFYYFRAISFLDLIFMIYYVQFGFRVSTLVPRSPWWQYGYDAWMYVVRFCGKSAHLLVLWLAFDRSVACWTRHVFYNGRLGKRRFVFKVIAAIFAFSLIYDIPPTYYAVRTKYFNETSPETALAISSRVLTGTEGVLALIFTSAVIVGLIQMSKRKRKLFGNNDNRTTRSGENNGKLIAQIKTNQSLCILQLCEGVPYLLVDIAIYLSYLTNFLMIDRDAASPVLVGGSYEENLKHQSLFAFQTYVRIVLITIADVYSHGFHFYNYLAFSPKFRRTVIGYLRRRGQAVSP